MYLKHKPDGIKIFVCIITHLISGTSHNKALRIIGGRDAVPGEFPYVIKMEVKTEIENGFVEYINICTGTLLSSIWSLTAGHCIIQLHNLMSLSPSTEGIIKYNLSTNRDYTYSNILSTFLHPNLYLSDTIRNDIGLLLTENVAISTFAKLSPVDYLSLYGEKVLVLGYGLTKGSNGYYGDAHSVNKSLQVLDAIITRCFYTGVYPSFCLGGICGQWSAVCPGDSGGPVLHTSGLVGINTATHSKNCKEELVLNSSFKLKTFAGMITPGSVYIDWIMNIIKSNTVII